MASVSDVLIAGAGPGGCAAALSLAQRGRRVTLVEPGKSANRGLAGEWLHPAGVTSLEQLGVRLDGADFIENHGFVLHPGRGHAPVPLPYPQGVAVSMRHQVLVDRLRQAAAGHPGVTLMLGERVIEAKPNGPVTTSAGTLPADLLVGADGRASLVRRALRPGEPPATTLSTTAGFELTGAQLPIEGYGHIVLGGPGSVLAYRISPDTIRLCLEIPPRRMPLPEMLRYLRAHYAPALPRDLRAAFLESLGCQPRVRWAVNRFRRRLFYGRDRCALVGDAVGFGHPLTAHGMTMAILDAECLVRRDDIASYTRERRARSWAPERVGTALHRALTDARSVLLRDSLLHLWSNDAAERDRMMRLLDTQEVSRLEFNLAVAHIAAVALSRTGESGPQAAPCQGAITRWARTPFQLISWLCWLYGPNSGPYPLAC
jgi:squalene monooxygenase